MSNITEQIQLMQMLVTAVRERGGVPTWVVNRVILQPDRDVALFGIRGARPTTLLFNPDGAILDMMMTANGVNRVVQLVEHELLHMEQLLKQRPMEQGVSNQLTTYYAALDLIARYNGYDDGAIHLSNIAREALGWDGYGGGEPAFTPGGEATGKTLGALEDEQFDRAQPVGDIIDQVFGMGQDRE